MIRTIEQRGTSGLVNELTKRAGEEQQRGSKDYSAGQSQLSAAMIPYSMDFTDAYTARLKELGATAGTAGSYETQAIADVRAGIKDNEKLKTASDKVSAAMTALADASEHTGQASAFHQIVLRFADQLDSDDDTSESGAADDASVPDTLRSASASQSLCAKAEKRRSRAQRKAERAQAKNNTADSTSLVDDKNAISMDDVMSYAGGLRPSFAPQRTPRRRMWRKSGEWTALRRQRWRFVRRFGGFVRQLATNYRLWLGENRFHAG